MLQIVCELGLTWKAGWLMATGQLLLGTAELR